MANKSHSKMQSPLLLIGDYYLCKNQIKIAKSKYSNASWITKNASQDSLDDIRMEASISGWNDDIYKIIVIESIPNRKNVREFLLNLASNCPDFVDLIIWDSENKIKTDPKTKTFNKTWNDFIKKFKKISNAKLINNGDKLDEKNSEDALSFVIKSFKCKGHIIDSNLATLFINIVGYNRGLLLSEIDKLCLIAPKQITSDFILNNAYPTSKESVLLKLVKTYNSCSYEKSIFITERFIESGFNPNELAVIILRQARLQLIAVYCWSKGMNRSSIISELCNMGKFPALTWHDSTKSNPIKKNIANEYKDPLKILNYLTKEHGIPRKYFNIKFKKGKRGKNIVEGMGRAESIPHPIVAQETIKFLENQLIRKNRNIKDKQLILDRSIKVYSFMLKKLINIRYGNNEMQDIQEMVRAITNVEISIGGRETS